MHRRRLKRFGLSENQLLANIANAPAVTIRSAEQQGRVVELELGLSARGNELKSYQVFVNAVPQFGAAGKPVPSGTTRVTEHIELGSGANKIEVSVLDEAGIESLRHSRVLRVDEPTKGDLYFLGFGVSRYRDQRLNLGFAHKDVLDMAALLRNAQGRFGQVHVQTYVDDQVTVAAIREAKKHFESAEVDDTVVLMVAGHGTYGRDAAADYYFVTHDTDVSRLDETAAHFGSLEDLLQGIAPRRKLFLIDTCESGERDETAAARATSRAAGRGLAPRTTRALELAPLPGGVPRPFLFDRERFIYYDLLRRSGAIVFSSSTGAEISYEQEELQNGVFTEELLRALTSPAADANGDQQLSMAELRGFVTRAVAERTGGLQHPVVDRDNPEANLALPLMPASALPAEIRPASSEPGRLPPSRMACFCQLGSEAPTWPALAWLLPLVVAARRCARRQAA